MRALLHMTKTRRNVLLLFVFTVLSLIGLVRLISYNSEKRRLGEFELQQNYKVVQNIGQIRSSLGETESFLQSFMLTGDPQWKASLSTTHDRVLKILSETAVMESDPMQQHKFSLIKKALEQKIAFQQTVVAADSITPELTAAMGFFGLNRRLTMRIQSPLDLLNEREQLLLRRNTESIRSAAIQAKFITIFSAVFVYMLILYALWQLRNQVRPGPAVKMEEETEDALQSQSTKIQAGFRGVFPMHDNRNDQVRRQQTTGIVRVLWSKDDLEENFGHIAAKMDEHEKEFTQVDRLIAAAIPEESDAMPEWKAAGLPEALTLHIEDHDHYLGQAVNANYYQPGPVYNRLPGYLPAGSSSFRVTPAPVITSPDFGRLPSQEAPGFKLSELIKEVLNPFYAQAEEKNIRLLHTIDLAIPNFLSGDAKKLRNILHSILDNAMRFTYKGYIQLTITGLNIQAEQAEIAFSIADTGRGIDSDQIQDLLHGTGSKLPALYHAKKLAESQQSQLMIHSTEEDGTVCCMIGTYRL